MKRVAINVIIIFVVLCILVLSSYTISSSNDSGHTGMNSMSQNIEQYFEGNLHYSIHSTFFEESISGAVIPVDMLSINALSASEFAQINENIEKRIYVKLLGCLSTPHSHNDISKTHLTIKRIKEIKKNKRPIRSMIGTYTDGSQMLTIYPNHMYRLQNKNGSKEEGNWFLHSRNIMVLASGSARTVLRINYKKRSFNTRDDHPTIFTLLSNLSSH